MHMLLRNELMSYNVDLEYTNWSLYFFYTAKISIVLWYDAVVIVGVINSVSDVKNVCRQIGFCKITFVLVKQSFWYFGTLMIGSKYRLVLILNDLAPPFFREWHKGFFSLIRMQVLYFLSNFDGVFFFVFPMKKST